MNHCNDFAPCGPSIGQSNSYSYSYSVIERRNMLTTYKMNIHVLRYKLKTNNDVFQKKMHCISIQIAIIEHVTTSRILFLNIAPSHLLFLLLLMYCITRLTPSKRSFKDNIARRDVCIRGSNGRTDISHHSHPGPLRYWVKSSSMVGN